MKECTRCGVVKPLNAFAKQAAAKDGKQRYCKECHRNINSGWKARNKTRTNIYNAAYYAQDPERHRARAKRWYSNNREHALNFAATYRREHYREIRERQSVVRSTDAYRERRRQWDADFRKRNPQIVRARKKLYDGIRHAVKQGTDAVPFTCEQLNAKFAYWNNQCWVCGDPATQIDHYKPIAAGGGHILCNLRPICRSCNARKKHRWPVPSRAYIAGFYS